MKCFCPLASGSKGNSLFLGTDNTKILIDAGINYNLLCSKLNEIKINIEQVDAILITHEHKDHIEGLKTIIPKIDIPVLTNSETAKGIYNSLHIMPKFKIFTTDESFEFNELIIHPFSIQHDTLDPVAFTIEIEDIKIGICADLGLVTSLVKKNLKNCHYLYLEANHDIDMLFASKRPNSLKKRISSRQGHLSNKECFFLLDSIINPDLKHIYLAHLSSECNNKELAKEVIQKLLDEKSITTKISIAHQEKVSKPIFF